MDAQPQELGTTLRKQRELRGISLADLSTATKIKESSLRCLEEGKFDALPALVFVKGFVIAYAKQVGLDPKPLVKDLQSILAPEGDAVVDLVNATADKPAPPVDNGPRLNVALVVFLVVLVATLTLSILMRSPGPGAT